MYASFAVVFVALFFVAFGDHTFALVRRAYKRNLALQIKYCEGKAIRIASILMSARCAEPVGTIEG